ncbi:MAG: hypothetical protein ACRDPH_03580 [Marmoricola sp.]
MTNPDTLPRSDPMRHTAKCRARFTDLADHLREDVEKVEDLRARALFETAAEVLLGLDRAFADYEEGSEPAWR